MDRMMMFKVEKPFRIDQQVDDAGGFWQYVETGAVDHTSQESVQVIATKRAQALPGEKPAAAMLTAMLVFSAGTEGEVAANLTLQGLHDLNTHDEVGSVSSASPQFARYIGGTFRFDASSSMLTISTYTPAWK